VIGLGKIGLDLRRQLALLVEGPPGAMRIMKKAMVMISSSVAARRSGA